LEEMVAHILIQAATRHPDMIQPAIIEFNVQVDLGICVRLYVILETAGVANNRCKM
jgi:hypothetical protein